MNRSLTNTYILNSDQIIVSVCDNWNKFAIENGAEMLISKNVIGTSIWDYIKGETTRMWFDTLLQFVSIKKEKIERPYRCDSPGIKRFMNLSVSFEGNGLIKLEHVIIKTEPMDVPVFMRYSANMLNNVKFRCSICGQVNHLGQWEEPNPHLFNDWDGKVFYTVCDPCKTLLPQS